MKVFVYRDTEMTFRVLEILHGFFFPDTWSEAPFGILGVSVGRGLDLGLILFGTCMHACHLFAKPPAHATEQQMFTQFKRKKVIH